MMKEHMLSTMDNPYNPFTEFDEWLNYDRQHKYFTLEFLDRIIVTSSDLSDADQSLAIELAIDEIVRENVNGLYVKVSAPD